MNDFSERVFDLGVQLNRDAARRIRAEQAAREAWQHAQAVNNVEERLEVLVSLALHRQDYPFDLRQNASDIVAAVLALTKRSRRVPVDTITDPPIEAIERLR